MIFEANKSYVFNFQFYLVQEDRQEEEHLCLQYKEFMGKVDLADQIQQISKVIHKSNKAWKKFSIMGLKCVCAKFLHHFEESKADMPRTLLF